ncbi:MAG: four helix bundle protein [Bacteroidetes bacterium]|nr:four helix bundle protein [Bacteroidota bacterium]
MENNYFDFEKLQVYQKALDYISFTYKLTNNFPTHETYGLTSQFRRASTSIALNMAEGYGETKPLFIRYSRISKGSLRECVVCTTIAARLNYINENEQKESMTRLTELSKMLSGLVSFVKKKIEEEKLT